MEVSHPLLSRSINFLVPVPAEIVEILKGVLSSITTKNDSLSSIMLFQPMDCFSTILGLLLVKLLLIPHTIAWWPLLGSSSSTLPTQFLIRQKCFIMTKPGIWEISQSSRKEIYDLKKLFFEEGLHWTEISYWCSFPCLRLFLIHIYAQRLLEVHRSIFSSESVSIGSCFKPSKGGKIPILVI